MIPLVYVAGPFTAPTAWEIERNVRAVEDVGALIVKAGAYPVMPHANTRYFHGTASAEFFYLGTMSLLIACHGAIFRDGWRGSAGARREHERAVSLSMPVYLEDERERLTLFEWVSECVVPHALLVEADVRAAHMSVAQRMRPAAEGVTPG